MSHVTATQSQRPSAPEPLTLLHLSDLQFGKNHRYPDHADSFDTLYAKLADDLDDLANERDLIPNAIVLTGDVAETSMPDEYKAARGFLEQLVEKLNIPRERVAILPGNHDVNRKLCQGARLQAEGHGAPFDQPYFAKFDNYREFFNDFYDGTRIFFDEQHLFQIYRFLAERVVVIGFNSCIQESEKKNDHYGWIGVSQARHAVELCDEMDLAQEWVRIAAMHHNFLGGSNLDIENLRDRDEILPILEEGRFRAVLHGHRHIADIKRLGNVNQETLKILAAGSAGLDGKALPDHPNQYQIVRIENHNDVTVFMRQYSTQAFGRAGKGKWTADPSLDKDGVVTFQLGDYAPPAAKPRPARRPAGSLRQARERFLEYVKGDHRFLPLRGFGTRLRVRIELEPVYVSLRAVPTHWEIEHRAKRNVDEKAEADMSCQAEAMEIGPALDFCQDNRYAGLVILGDPGSGKTTLLKYVALCLAGVKPMDQTGIKAERVPLFLPLREVKDFTCSVADSLQAYYADLNLPTDFFPRLLQSGRCVLLLDGLDEVATTDRRLEAERWIETERKLHSKNPILITSRFAGYRGKARLPDHYLEMHIQAFTEDDWRRFVANWYLQVETGQQGETEQARRDARKLADDLIREVTTAADLKDLARNPLMLQIICLVHRSRGRMPRRKTELYEECIQVLLEKWDEAKGLEVFLTATEARQVLRPLALWLHEEEGRTSAEKEPVKEILLPQLARVKPHETQVEEHLDRILTSVRDRTGLFVGLDVSRYGFQHLSFQEFLAAEELTKRGQHQRLVRTFGRSWWEQPTLLALAMDEPLFQQAFFKDLIRSRGFAKHLPLALECVRHWLTPDVEPFTDVFGNTKIPWRVGYNCALLLREMRGPEAVRLLKSAMEDPRKKIASAARAALIRLDALEEAEVVPSRAAQWTVNETDGTELLRIPAGEFLMGSDAHDSDERPQHSVHLDAYFIAKTPVSNAQYRIFVEATGHREPRRWDNKRYNQPNQPVVGVSWRDAVAYCEWAGLRLPTEAEWEKAARGTDDRQWPWGNEPPNDKRCNFGDNVGHPSEVGSYPDGASPYGCLDMAGNVWEWCSTKWRGSYSKPADESPEGDDPRVLRGGAWYKDADGVRCSYRDWPHPGGRLLLIGFRCAQ